MTPEPQASQSIGGFTLLETLAVLAIIGLATAVTTSAISPIRNRNMVAKSASELELLVTGARDAALSSGSPRHVYFNATSRGFSLREDARRIAVPDGVGVDLVTALEEGSDSVDRRGTATLLFLPDGTGSGGTMTLRAGSVVRILHVSWLTGRISSE